MESINYYCAFTLLIVAAIFVGTAVSEDAAVAKDTTTKVATTAKPQVVKCLSCNSIKNKHCDDWDGFSHSIDCKTDDRIDSTKPIGCRKIVQTVKEKRYVTRQCTNEVAPDIQGCVERVGTKNIQITYCHCKGKDNYPCNSGMSLPATSLLSLLLLLLSAAAARVMH